MMTRWFLALSLSAAALSASAQAVRLDDSLSSRTRVDLNADWQDRTPARGAQPDVNKMVALSSVDVRLKTEAFTGKQARIYLVLPALGKAGALPTQMQMQWRTRGVMRAGQLRPGTRALVYQGPVGAAVMGDRFDFAFALDGRQYDKGLQFESYFEIEVE